MLGTNDFIQVEKSRRLVNHSATVDECEDRVEWSVTIMRHLMVWPSMAISCYIMYLIAL